MVVEKFVFLKGCSMKKYNNNIEKKIEVLELEKDVLNILKDNDIKLVGDIWVLNRKRLKEMGITDKDIKYIVIRLQLLGLDLNKKMYN